MPPRCVIADGERDCDMKKQTAKIDAATSEAVVAPVTVAPVIEADKAKTKEAQQKLLARFVAKNPNLKPRVLKDEAGEPILDADGKVQRRGIIGFRQMPKGPQAICACAECGFKYPMFISDAHFSHSEYCGESSPNMDSIEGKESPNCRKAVRKANKSGIAATAKEFGTIVPLEFDV